MDCFCCKPIKDEPIARNNSRTFDIDSLSRVIQNRSQQITDDIIESSLNSKALPDFLERRLLNVIINLVFNIVITTLLQPQRAR